MLAGPEYNIKHANVGANPADSSLTANWRRIMKQAVLRMLILAPLAAGVALPFQPWNGPAGPAWVKRLADEADLVAVGTSVQGEQAGSQVTYALSIERVLKGTVLPGRVAYASWTMATDEGFFRRQLPAVRRLWFLKSMGGTAYTIMPTVVGHATVNDVCISVPPGETRPRFAYPSAASVHDKIAYEMAASAEAFANGEISNSLPILPSSSGASPQALTAVHRLLAQSGVPRVKAIGYRGLLMQNDRNAIEEIEQQAASLAQANSGALIATAIGELYRNADPQGIAALGHMATGDQSSRTLAFKNAAARALAWIHTREALPYLAKMLSDPDPAIRAYGVGGLAMFANNEPVQAASPISTAPRPPVYQPWYRTPETASHSTMSKEVIIQQESEYIVFWSRWWQDNQATIMAGLPPKQQKPSVPPDSSTTTQGSGDSRK
jgi:hypothetical protein